MRFRMIIYDNIQMREIKNIIIEEVSSFQSACKIAELHEKELHKDYSDTTIALERIDDD